MRLTRGRRGKLVFLAALALLGLSLLRVAVWRPLALVGESPDDGYARAAGVVHVHTTLSDGGGDARGGDPGRARRGALDFLGITDHNNLDAKPLEGYHDGVLVLVGSELSTPAGHLLGLGLDRDPAWRFSGDGLDSLEDVRDLGGVPFAAHPFSARADLRWNGWDLPGPWGIELLNGDSDARRAGPRVLLSVGLYRLNPGYALLQGLPAPDEALRRWDDMLATRDVVGLAGSDAHSRLALTKRWAIRFPSYESLFAQAQEPPAPRSSPRRRRRRRPRGGPRRVPPRPLLHRPRRARSRRRLPVHGCRRAKGGASRWATTSLPPRVCGQWPAAACPRGPASSCCATAGRWGRGRGASTRVLPGPGVYRVEARVPGWPVPWVVTNPVYVHDETTREARRQAGEWPAPPTAPHATSSPSASLPGSPAFGPEFDPTSWMDAAVDAPGAGPDGSDALRLAFRLAAPSASQPFTWCALVNRQDRDLERLHRPPFPRPGRRGVPLLGAGARPEPGLRRRGARVVARLRPDLGRVARGADARSRASAPSTGRPTADSTPVRPAPSSSCWTAPR